jgi:hypothetical protein
MEPKNATKGNRYENLGDAVRNYTTQRRYVVATEKGDKEKSEKTISDRREYRSNRLS